MALLIFEGPDGSGKSTIAKAVSQRTGLPYFKNPKEHKQKDQNETLLMAKYSATYFADFLTAVHVDAIIDRHYPSEFVYAQVEHRQIDLDTLRYVDVRFAASKSPVIIIVCMKKSYAGFVDKLGHADEEKYPKLCQKYQEFIQWTECKATVLDTSGQNLSKQCDYIMQLLNDPGAPMYATLEDHQRTH